METILVTGAAGFIGSHVVKALSKTNKIVGIDNLNDYYDPILKMDRLNHIKHDNFTFIKMDITDLESLKNVFEQYKFSKVIHLAAQAGVRYSIDNPHAYVQSNLVGMTNILECCRYGNIEHLVYASSSSVYGLNETVPFKEDHKADSPVSFYGATKKSNEQMAHSYAHLFKMNITGLRFFTVYGEWGRPDMAPFLFTKAISEGNPIKVFNYGKMERDFTYIADIVNGIVKIKDVLPESRKGNQNETPYHEVYNIGNNKPEKLGDFIECIEDHLGVAALKELLPMQDGDVLKTYACTEKIKEACGYEAKTSIDKGLGNFVNWYKEYYQIEKLKVA